MGHVDRGGGRGEGVIGSGQEGEPDRVNVQPTIQVCGVGRSLDV